MKIGEQAKNFTLNDHTGKSISLDDFQGTKHVVVFFYPKDDTPG